MMEPWLFVWSLGMYHLSEFHMKKKNILVIQGLMSTDLPGIRVWAYNKARPCIGPFKDIWGIAIEA